MFNWLRRWRQSNYEWNHGQNVVWPRFLVVGAGNLTQFQHEAVQQLSASVGPVHLRHAGTNEIFLTGKLPGTEADIYIYPDGAQIHNGAKVLFMAEREDHATPQALIQQFVAAAHSNAQSAS